jgi:hypothetical protein
LARNDANALRVVACGHPLPGHGIRIVDATGCAKGLTLRGGQHIHPQEAAIGDSRGAANRLARI